MASPFQLQSRRRKIIYTALILGLFTASLFLRQVLLEPRAAALELREFDRGDVSLTGSAFRLSLTGSRGLVVCYLWWTAMDKQKKNEWNELEMIVRSLTKLQPHFVIPWLFQSWNLAYNVSVESDRIRDKYFFISRGIELLAEGERQNKGNPDLRFSMGFYNQHKIGLSDEANTFRCLYQMSAIDPVERDAKRLRLEDSSQPDLARFEQFCQRHPMLIRRLREQLKMNSPEEILDFLNDNFKIPSRYDEKQIAAAPGAEPRGILKKPEEQFPVLAPPDPERTHEPANPDAPDFDNFQVARDWYAYANKPLPPPSSDITAPQVIDPRRHRLPRYMTAIIFRDYPARGQSYVAEYLEKEGWLGRDGWTIRDWFLNSKEETVVGKGPDWALEAWDRSFQMWQQYGRENGLYLPPEELAALERRAEKFRKRFNLPPNTLFAAQIPASEMTPELADSYRAHNQLYWIEQQRTLTNFPHFYYRSQVGSEPKAAEVRKEFFLAEQYRKAASPEQALETYKEAMPKWRDILLENPGFRADPLVQEEAYEIEVTYLDLVHQVLGKEYFGQLKKASVIGDFLAQAALRPPLATCWLPPAAAVRDLDPNVDTAFDVTDKHGQPLLGDEARYRVRSRLGMPSPSGVRPPPQMNFMPHIEPHSEPPSSMMQQMQH